LVERTVGYGWNKPSQVFGAIFKAQTKRLGFFIFMLNFYLKYMGSNKKSIFVIPLNNPEVIIREGGAR